jgi:hypothetical protein
MPNAALFLFLAAIVVSAFSFLSVATWVTAPSKERLARDRFALLKTLAEQPGENATRIIALLQQEDQARAAKRALAERRSWIDGGTILIAFAVGLAGMLRVLVGSRVWSVGLIPLLVGVALILIGLFRNHATNKETK